jgi:hypothetical protein
MKKNILQYHWLPFLAMLLLSTFARAEDSDLMNITATLPKKKCEAPLKNCKTAQPTPNPVCTKKYPPTIDFKAGYFFFSSSTLRKIYDKGGLDLQLSGTFPIWRWLQVYASAEYITRHGKLLNGGQNTRICEIPASLGLQPVVAICPKLHYYLTLGPRYFFVRQHNHSPYLDRIVAHNGVGGFVNTGFHFFPVKYLLIDVFAEYSYKRMHFNSHRTNVVGQTVQVGGFTFGGGLGYAF